MTALSGLSSPAQGEHDHSVVTFGFYRLQSASWSGFHMTSLPQTQPRNFAGLDSRRRSTPLVPGAAAMSGAAARRAREALPALDPSQEYGCVDWFLYPDEAQAEAKVKRARA
jgi:hypothetical protein